MNEQRNQSAGKRSEQGRHEIERPCRIRVTAPSNRRKEPGEQVGEKMPDNISRDTPDTEMIPRHNQGPRMFERDRRSQSRKIRNQGDQADPPGNKPIRPLVKGRHAGLDRFPYRLFKNLVFVMVRRPQSVVRPSP